MKSWEQSYIKGYWHGKKVAERIYKIKRYIMKLCEHLREKFNCYEDKEYYCAITGHSCGTPTDQIKISKCIERINQRIKEEHENE